MGCISAIVGILLLLLAIYLFTEHPLVSTMVVVLLVIAGIWVKSKEQEESQKMDRLYEETVAKAQKVYDEIKSTIEIPNNVSKVFYRDGYASLLKTQHYIWISEGMLHLFPSEPPFSNNESILEKIALFKLPIDKIEYFAIHGEFYRENKISGGGGGGSSIEGAVVGAAIAGGAGAIIGSRKDVKEIKSSVVTHDTRETNLVYIDENNNKQSLVFNYKDYEALNDLIPSKAFEIVSAVRTQSLINQTLNNTGITNQLRELSQLKDEGILTEEEFNEKKKSLLGKL